MKNSNNQKASIAVVGSGYWGKNLVRNFDQLGALKIVCDKNEELLYQFKGQYPEVDTCIAFHDVLRRKDIHGIVIATPAETHYGLAREALLSKKHVYVEKPLVLEERQAEELIDLSHKQNRILMVGHLLQYHPVYLYLKDIVARGEMGRINYIYSHRLNLGKIRREENILWSFAPHDISMILGIAGEEPETVMATGGNYLHNKIADVTTTHMAFPSGLRAHVFVSWLHPFKEQKLVLVGDKKMAVFDDTRPWEDKLWLFPHSIEWQNNVPVPNREEPEKPVIEQKEPLKEACRQFLTSISSGEPPITDGQEGLRVLRVLKRSQQSLDSESSAVQKLDKQAADGEKDCFVHATAVIDDHCKIGNGSKIWHFSHILGNSSIGENCNIGQNVMLGPDVAIGDNCKIQNNVSVYKGVTLEDGVFCGPSMVFTNIYNPRAEIGKMDQVRPTLVKRGATIGANATIVCGTTLGKYCFIGAGAVVNRNVPDHALCVGNPAKQIGWVCRCGERLTDQLDCMVCGKKYIASTNNKNIRISVEEI
jgi:UDP-2-acetamido-3-amino-2,3-dideoxy-glucuronate N-acetyltransferase